MKDLLRFYIEPLVAAIAKKIESDLLNLYAGFTLNDGNPAPVESVEMVEWRCRACSSHGEMRAMRGKAPFTKLAEAACRTHAMCANHCAEKPEIWIPTVATTGDTCPMNS